MTGAGPSRLSSAIEEVVRAGNMPFRFVGAHDALSAQLGEEAGFDGIWASSLEVSASHAVPDDGSLPQREMVERVLEMSAAVRCPVLVDATNGDGDLAATVRAVEAAGAAGLMLEDKASPRTNSLSNSPHRLESPAAYGAKLERALASRSSSSFMIVARVEALAAGGTPAAAAERAEAYVDAGAEAVVVHTRSREGTDVLEVLRRLQLPVPIGLIPTTYFGWSACDLRAAGAEFVVYANQGLRAKVLALRRVFAAIYATGSSEAVEGGIARIEEVLEVTRKVP